MRFLLVLSIIGKLTPALGRGEEKRDKDIVEGMVVVAERDLSNCGADSAWEPIPSTYIAADTDAKLISWWKNISSQPSY